MDSIFALAAGNLLSPPVLCFVLGVVAAFARSDLAFPQAVAKGMSLYLLFAIGFKGGAGVAAHGIDFQLVATLVAGMVLSAGIPFLAFPLLRAMTRLDRVDAAAVAAHYGSISIVTFVAATSAVQAAGLSSENFMVATAAVMEAPAILSALWIAHRDKGHTYDKALFGEILANGSIVLLTGAFIIGIITGPEGLADIDAFIIAPFLGVLCLFLLDMGLVAGRGLKNSARELTGGLVAFGLIMPVIGSLLGLVASLILGLSVGGAALLMTLAASASYIAVPAAMRIALPEARPSIYLTLSLGVTFPFNLTVGIPLYVVLARWFAGG